MQACIARSEAAFVLRSIPLWSESLGLTGRADAVEVWPDGSFVPVEYKMGGRHGDAAEIQVAAQALCLEEMTGRPVLRAGIWFAGPRRREDVDIDTDLRSRTLQAVAEVRACFSAPCLPAAPNDARCENCQLLGHCLPDIVSRPERVRLYLEREVFTCAP